MEKVKKIGALVPGFVLALVIAAAAKFLEGLLPIHLIGASVIALFIGMEVLIVKLSDVQTENRM